MARRARTDPGEPIPGLATGAGGRHQRRGPASRGLGTQLAAQTAAGHLERVDEGLVTGARLAARLVDAALADDDESRFVCRQVLAEWREWLDRLRSLSPAVHDDHQDLDALIADLSARLGDAPHPG